MTLSFVPPQPGAPVFIDPRAEDPLNYIKLDIFGTFFFLPLKKKGTRDYIRAKYTIDTLRLNLRAALVKARRIAFGGYCARLEQYISSRDGGVMPDRLAAMVRELGECPHPTVWREMKRQRQTHENLRSLFEAAPEALKW